jgi:hypothetical protein
VFGINFSRLNPPSIGVFAGWIVIGSSRWTRSEFDSVDLGLDAITQVRNPIAADPDLFREWNQHDIRAGWTFAILGFVYQDAGDLVAQAHEYVIQSADGFSEFIEFPFDLGSRYFSVAS